MYCSTKYSSPVGMLTIASDGKNIVGLWIDGQKYFGESIPENMVKKDDLPVFDSARNWLDRYFNGERPEAAELPLRPMGSSFRQEVWNMLCDIPYGKIITYGEIAETIAAKRGLNNMSGQAVGGAVGHNPVSIIIPCHRVVGTGGSLTGYAGGIDIKVKLLEHEGVDMSKLFIPKRGTAL